MTRDPLAAPQRPTDDPRRATHSPAQLHRLGVDARPPSARRWRILGGPGGYLSARAVGDERPGDYARDWQTIATVTIPRRALYRSVPQATGHVGRAAATYILREWAYPAVLRHYRAAGCAV